MKLSRNGTLVGPTASPLRAILAVISIALLLSWNFPAIAFSSAGDLDGSFGDAGKVTAGFLLNNDWLYAIAVQPDGRIVAAGSTHNRDTGTDFALTRFHSDGSRDCTFGLMGQVTTDFFGESDGITAVSLLPDGQIVVAGRAGSSFAVARYASNGLLDTTFGVGGKVVTDFFGDEGWATGLAVLNDGKILAAGTTWNRASGNYDFGLIRYDSDGSVDWSFGDYGRVVTDLSGSHDFGNSIGIQSSGKIVVGGYAFGRGSDFALARYRPNGRLDRSFGNGGKVITDMFGGTDEGSSLAIATDDKIVLAGRAYTGKGYSSFGLARYNPNGALDTTFGVGGKAKTDFGYASEANAIEIQVDGKIVAAGYTRPTQHGNYNFAVLRYSTDGSLDPTFGGGGKTVTDFHQIYDMAYAVAIAPDGRIIVGGVVLGPGGGLDFAIACYLAR